MEHSIFSPALFNAIAVMQANERERKKIEITEAGISIPSGYGSGRNTLAVLAQISFELIAHIAHLQETAEGLPEQPSNLKQIFAQIYRNGQITLDKTAHLCMVDLACARTPKKRILARYKGPPQ
jgi:hypothetical protein